VEKKKEKKREKIKTPIFKLFKFDIVVLQLFFWVVGVACYTLICFEFHRPEFIKNHLILEVFLPLFFLILLLSCISKYTIKKMQILFGIQYKERKFKVIKKIHTVIIKFLSSVFCFQYDAEKDEKKTPNPYLQDIFIDEPSFNIFRDNLEKNLSCWLIKPIIFKGKSIFKTFLHILLKFLIDLRIYRYSSVFFFPLICNIDMLGYLYSLQTLQLIINVWITQEIKHDIHTRYQRQ